MKNVTQWIKANLITTVSIVVILIAIIFIFYFHEQGTKLTEKIKAQNNTADKITGYMNQTLDIPSADPAKKPRKLRNVVINQKFIDFLKDKYHQMDDQRKQLFDFISKVNKDDHKIFIDNLFPKAKSSRVLFDARDAYKKAIKNMASSLNAGGPLSKEKMDEVVQNVDLAVKQERANKTNNKNNKNSLSTSEIKSILQRKKIQLINALEDRAKSISIYANTNTSLQDEQFPYTVDKWPFLGSKPTISQAWEGQMELWLQQDITRVINLVNNNIKDSEISDSKTSNVLHNPIKRLIGMRVVPGYIGLQTRGFVPIAPSQSEVIDKVSKSKNNKSSKNKNNSNNFLSIQKGYGDKTNLNQNPNGTYPPPVNDLHTDDPKKVASKNFYISITGRTSNSSYDVRQVKLSIIIDYTKLPIIINTFSKVNFMTVVFCNIHNVDTHQALVQGYDYGQGNIVRADMIIESIWFRNWTKKLMPQKVRKYLGLE